MAQNAGVALATGSSSAQLCTCSARLREQRHPGGPEVVTAHPRRRDRDPSHLRVLLPAVLLDSPGRLGVHLLACGHGEFLDHPVYYLDVLPPAHRQRPAAPGESRVSIANETSERDARA